MDKGWGGMNLGQGLMLGSNRLCSCGVEGMDKCQGGMSLEQG